MAEPTRHEQETATEDIATSSVPSAAPDDTAKLSAAVQRLDIDQKPPTSTPAADKKAVAKIDFADVNILVDRCDLNKTRATELLRAHDGDLREALRAYVGLGSRGISIKSL